MGDSSPVCAQCGATLLPQMLGVCPSCALQWATSESLAENTRLAAPSPIEIQASLSAFHVHSLVGQGGMGIVYEATQVAIGRRVALKILPLDGIRNERFIDRFKREAHTVGKLRHPNILTIYDAGESAEFLYLAMEFIDGCSLRELITHGGLAQETVLPWIIAIGDALQYAHEHDVVHRDIKPENILVDQNGNVWVVDFGIATWSRMDASHEKLTTTGKVFGTPSYAAPEAKSRNAVDHRADIYSLGVLLYELLTGKAPLVDYESVSLVGSADERLDGVIRRCLKNDPDQRYQSISDMKQDIERIHTTHSVSLKTLCAAAVLAVAVGLLLMWAGQQLVPPNVGGDSTTADAAATTNATDEPAPFLLRQLPQTLGNGHSTAPVVADVDADGDIDLIFSNAEEYGNRIWLNAGDGTFEQASEPLGMEAFDFVSLDVDGDGNPDLATTDAKRLLGVLRGLGNGQFEISQELNGSDARGILATGDLDNDGDVDIIRAAGKWGPAAAAPTRIYLCENGRFTATSQLLDATMSFSVSVADLNGDNLLDIAVGAWNGAPDQIWINDGQAAFVLSEQVLGSTNTREMLLEDFDGDSDIDILLVGTDVQSVWANDGRGQFTLVGKIEGISNASCASAADFDADGDMDVFIGCFGGQPDHVLLNDGDKNFKRLDVALGRTYSMKSVTVDVNGDGRVDIVVANANAQPNTIWLNLPNE